MDRMIRHMVSWNFKPELSSEKRDELEALLSRRMSELKELIPCILRIECFAPPLKGSNCDLALYVEVASEEDLLYYQDHPGHVAVAEIVRANCCDRRCADIPVTDAADSSRMYSIH